MPCQYLPIEIFEEAHQPAIDTGASSPDPETIWLLRELLSAINAGPTREAEVFQYRRQGYSLREIAERMGIAIGTAKSHHYHLEQRIQYLCKSDYLPPLRKQRHKSN